MKLKREHLLLYLVTDQRWCKSRPFIQDVEEAIKNGVTMVQLRAKESSYNDLIRQAQELRKLTSHYQVPFIMNDNVKAALEVNADGVHLGQQDLSIKAARELLGPGKIIGASARTVRQAQAAEAAGADYLGVGQVFQSSTKLDTVDVSHETLREICTAITIPVVAIGGITADNITALKGSHIAGAAVVSAILSKPDIGRAAAELENKIRQVTS